MYILYKFYHNHLYNINAHLIRQSLRNVLKPRMHAWVPESSVQLNSFPWISRKPIQPNNSKLKAPSPTTLLWFLFMFYCMRTPPPMESPKPKPKKCPQVLLSHTIFWRYWLWSYPWKPSSLPLHWFKSLFFFTWVILFLLTCSLSGLQSIHSIDIRARFLIYKLDPVPILFRRLWYPQKLQVINHTS